MTLKTDHLHHAALFGTVQRRVTLLAAAVLLLAAPAFAGRYWLNIASLTALAVIGAAALNLLMGVAGQVSIGNAAFLAIGGFTLGVGLTNLSIPVPVAVLLSGVVAAAVGVVVGLPALRLRGIYLAISTLALHFIALFVLGQWQSSDVGPAGYRPRVLVRGMGGLDFTTTWYVICVTVAAAVLLFLASLMRTRFGRAWFAIHHSDIAAELLGVRVTEFKVLVFSFSSFLIGIQGALAACYIGVVSDEIYTFELAVRYIAIIIIGGMGSVVFGSLLGAAFVTALPFAVSELFTKLPNNFLGLQPANRFDVEVLLYGVAIMFFLLFEPAGLVSIARRARGFFARWPLPKELTDEVW